MLLLLLCQLHAPSNQASDRGAPPLLWPAHASGSFWVPPNFHMEQPRKKISGLLPHLELSGTSKIERTAKQTRVTASNYCAVARSLCSANSLIYKSAHLRCLPAQHSYQLSKATSTRYIRLRSTQFSFLRTLEYRSFQTSPTTTNTRVTLRYLPQ